MQLLDWLVVAGFCLLSLGIGIALTRKASRGIESYFLSERKLGWWLAGTSMAATAFSSDTPLLVTGIVRRKGIWGNWEIWALAISTMFAVFFFARLWKRAGVMTEVELVELRYSGRPAAFLRGFKALYWGIFYNAFIMGAWPMTGLAKVMHEVTGWSKAESIFFCMGLTAVYSCLAGYWGVILTDLFQFIVAMIGAFLLAFYAVHAAGGLDSIVAHLAHTDKLHFFPPAAGHTPTEVFSSPFGWFLGLILVQWWAWKNTDGGGIIVQRIASCKNERQAIYATLWFNIAQYALRAWPWIITALASLVLLPNLADHEAAYPRLIALYMPTGLKGLMIAAFFAAFMSTMSTHLNWGSSYFLSDFYRRFIKKEAPEKHYVEVARLTSIFLATAATCVSFYTSSIGNVFTFVLNLTAAVGPVYLLRWFWWRINPWSEMAAMAASLPVILLRTKVLAWLGIPDVPLFQLLYMVGGAALFWLPATFLTPPATREKLDEFRKRVNPPGFWGKQLRKEDWSHSLLLWGVATTALMLTSFGPLVYMVKDKMLGMELCLMAAAGWVAVVRLLRQEKPETP